MKTGFEGQTVVTAAAGCACGAAMCESLARAGARVVVIDADERAALDIARRHPEAMDALALDVMEPRLCGRLGAVWKDEPLHLLVQLQPIRHRDRAARALVSVETLTGALAKGLRAGQGLVVIVDAAPAGGSVAEALMAEAWGGLPAALQGGFSDGKVAVNGIRLSRAAPRRGELDALCAALGALARPGPARIGGGLLSFLS